MKVKGSEVLRCDAGWRKMMNAHFAAATPNLRIMEVDIDRLPWDEESFTNAPRFEQGQLIVPDEPG